MARTGIRVVAAVLLLGVMSSGCAVTLMSKYDERTEELASAVGRKMWSQLEQLKGETAPACLYPQHMESYREIRVDLTDLMTRAGALELNRLTQAQVAALQSSWSDFERLHQLKQVACLSPAEITPVETALQQTVSAILKLELEKKERR